MLPLRLSVRRGVLIVLAVALCSPAPAGASNHAAQPTPQPLWQAFPLDDSGGHAKHAKQAKQAKPSKPAKPAARERARNDGGGGGVSTGAILAAVAAALVLAALVGAFVAWRHGARAWVARRADNVLDAVDRRRDSRRLGRRPPIGGRARALLVFDELADRWDASAGTVRAGTALAVAVLLAAVLVVILLGV